MDTKEFLSTIYDGRPGWFTVNFIQDKFQGRSFRTESIDSACTAVETLSKHKKDIWFSLGTANNKPSTGRIKEREVKSLPGFWADIDVGDEGHKDVTRLRPPSIDHALSLVFSPDPTLVVSTGGGIHAYWLFDEPWVFEPGDLEPTRVTNAWHERIATRAALYDWHVDNVSDLARVLRLPGTKNHKTDNARPVEVIQEGIRYSREYLTDLVKIPRVTVDEGGDVSWVKETIAAHGWQHCHDDKWVRPGKDCSEGISAQINPRGMSVYSDGADLKHGWHTVRDVAKFYQVALIDQGLIRLVSADSILMKPVHWLWEGRIPLGAMTLLGGREGIGKSMLAYTVAAQVTKGELQGANAGKPHSVAVVATEDSWSHTIKPRLVAAGADLKRIFVVEASDGGGVSLPKHIDALADQLAEEDVSLLLLDPLMSRLDGKLDTHKDSDVRIALEPLTKMVDDTGVAMVGLIHVNKSGSTDPLTTLMGSRAFAAVARAVLFVAQDPEEPDIRVVGSPKNNLGRSDLPDLNFNIIDMQVGEYEGEPIHAGKLVWTDSSRSLIDVLESSRERRRSSNTKVDDWLEDYLVERLGECVPLEELKDKAQVLGFSYDMLKRAKKRMGITDKRTGYQAPTCWQLGVDLIGDSHD